MSGAKPMEASLRNQTNLAQPVLSAPDLEEPP